MDKTQFLLGLAVSLGLIGTITGVISLKIHFALFEYLKSKEEADNAEV